MILPESTSLQKADICEGDSSDDEIEDDLENLVLSSGEEEFDSDDPSGSDENESDSDEQNEDSDYYGSGKEETRDESEVKKSSITEGSFEPEDPPSTVTEEFVGKDSQLGSSDKKDSAQDEDKISIKDKVRALVSKVSQNLD